MHVYSILLLTNRLDWRVHHVYHVPTDGQPNLTTESAGGDDPEDEERRKERPRNSFGTSEPKKNSGGKERKGKKS